TAQRGHPGEPVTVKASVDYLTCKDICIPYPATVELSLAAGEALPSELSYDLDRYRARVPGSDGRHGLEIIEVQVASAGETVDLQVVATALEPFSAPDLFVEGPEGTFFGKPEISLSEGGRTANIAIRGGGLDGPLGTAGVPLILTLVDGARMLEKATLGQPGSVNVGIRDGAGSSSIWYILLLALLGGLILNLMPCVLPVLSLKLLSVVSYGGRNTADVRRGFLATAAGIVFSFLLIAGALIGFQSAGFAIGWGIQFQQPLFLVIMTLIVLLFACNLFGLFEIILPGRVADLAGTAGNTHSLGGHFLTGAFATLLATPCSAPFLGTAVGFALSRGPVDILSIFLFLG
ncbi:MAG: cytochrome c biogenesis protein CcdA, partial [Rickettsiales bacterium]